MAGVVRWELYTENGECIAAREDKGSSLQSARSERNMDCGPRTRGRGGGGNSAYEGGTDVRRLA